MILDENLFEVFEEGQFNDYKVSDAELERARAEIPNVEMEVVSDSEIEPDGPELGEATGIANIIHDLIIDENEAIQGYNNAAANMENYPELVKLMHDIAAEEYAHIGELQTALEKVISPNAENIDKGEVEAEENLDDHNKNQEELDEGFFDQFNPKGLDALESEVLARNKADSLSEMSDEQLKNEIEIAKEQFKKTRYDKEREKLSKWIKILTRTLAGEDDVLMKMSHNDDLLKATERFIKHRAKEENDVYKWIKTLIRRGLISSEEYHELLNSDGFLNLITKYFYSNNKEPIGFLEEDLYCDICDAPLPKEEAIKMGDKNICKDCSKITLK